MICGIARRFCGKQVGIYKVIQYIGAGRYGVCFLAEVNGETVILKRFKAQLFRRNHHQNFLEIPILSQLDHAGIPKLLVIVNEKNFYGPILEQKSGNTLESMLFKQKYQFNQREIWQIGIQLIAIIKYLHEKGIVHRDIRIPNVLVNGNVVSLVDYGLARWEDGKRYTRDIDFSFFGDVLLYLLYSSYKKEKRQSRPWFEELSLSFAQRDFLKRLLKLAEPYQNIDDIARDFRIMFAPD